MMVENIDVELVLTFGYIYIYIYIYIYLNRSRKITSTRGDYEHHLGNAYSMNYFLDHIMISQECDFTN